MLRREGQNAGSPAPEHATNRPLLFEEEEPLLLLGLQPLVRRLSFDIHRQELVPAVHAPLARAEDDDLRNPALQHRRHGSCVASVSRGMLLNQLKMSPL